MGLTRKDYDSYTSSRKRQIRSVVVPLTLFILSLVMSTRQTTSPPPPLFFLPATPETKSPLELSAREGRIVCPPPPFPHLYLPSPLYRFAFLRSLTCLFRFVRADIDELEGWLAERDVTYKGLDAELSKLRAENEVVSCP